MAKLSESTYRQDPVLLDGYYPATLKEVTEYTKTYDGKETPRLAWIFDVEADEDALDDSIEVGIEDWEPTGHYEVAAHTGKNKSTKQNSNWYKLDMDVIVPQGVLDTDVLIGAACIVNVSSFVADDGLTKNTVEKVRKPKKGQKAAKTLPEQQKRAADAKKPREEVEIDESDFSDLPF